MINGFNPKIPILMYHEISDVLSNGKNSFNKMTPLYNIPAAIFENQIRFLASAGYKSLLPEEVQKLSKDGKYVIITFDDGLKGNYKYAFPILKKYGFKATIFIAVDKIGAEDFMDWEELYRLLKEGISIQSHTMSHRPLQNLSNKEIYEELYTSKQTIEKNLNTKVQAISFPHGSYNQEVIRIAQEAGYRFMLTSNIECVYLNSFQGNFAVLGRIAMTNKMDLNKLIKIIEYNKLELTPLIFVKTAKNILKRMIGVENYRILYRRFFKIKL